MTEIVDSLEAFAREVGTKGPVAVAGARTRWDVGGSLSGATRILRAPRGIVEIRPEEMTVRVRAGTPVAELHEALAAHKQRTSLPERGGTVGGALAVGQNDLHVLGRGRVRAGVLQLRYVSCDGRMVTGGGPTVKNVSGFDLPRLMVGSLGTLGLLAETLLRTQPTGEVAAWYRGAVEDPQMVTRALYRPTAVLWDGTRTWVHLEGHGADVRQQLGVLRRLGSFDPVEGPPPLPSNRWSLRPSDVVAHSDRIPGPFVASVGVGTVYASRAEPPRRLSAPHQALAGRVKQAFDPTGRLSPGRAPERR